VRDETPDGLGPAQPVNGCTVLSKHSQATTLQEWRPNQQFSGGGTWHGGGHGLYPRGAEGLRLPARRLHRGAVLRGLHRRTDALRRPLPARLDPGPEHPLLAARIFPGQCPDDLLRQAGRDPVSGIPGRRRGASGAG
jgi:hypothetical protein